MPQKYRLGDDIVYRIATTAGKTEVLGQRVHFPGHEDMLFGVHRNPGKLRPGGKRWVVSELRTGLRVGCATTKDIACQLAKKAIMGHGAENIRGAIDRIVTSDDLATDPYRPADPKKKPLLPPDPEPTIRPRPTQAQTTTPPAQTRSADDGFLWGKKLARTLRRRGCKATAKLSYTLFTMATRHPTKATFYLAAAYGLVKGR